MINSIEIERIFLYSKNAKELMHFFPRGLGGLRIICSAQIKITKIKSQNGLLSTFRRRIMVHIKLTFEKILRVLLVFFVLFNAVIPSSLAKARSKDIFNLPKLTKQDSSLWSELFKGLFQTSCLPSGDLIIVSGETCSLTAGTYSYTSITVQTGGTLLILGNATLNQGVIINANEIIIESGGRIDATGQGYPSGGPGAGQGPNPIWTGGGAGYGGKGESGDGAGGNGYGIVKLPVDLGSAGGVGRCGLISICPGGYGGGAVRLVIATTLTIDGEIIADGVSGGGRSGGGSGGSILIETGTISGTGTIHSNGGPGMDGGGDGAGGRIAVYYNTSTFPLDAQHLQARGKFQGGNGGGPGTVYLEETGSSLDKLVVDNGGNSVTNYAVHPAGGYAYDQIEMSGNGKLRLVGTSSQFTLTGNDVLTGDGTGYLEVEGTLITSSNLLLSDVSVTILGNLQGAENITLQSPSVLELYATSPLHTGIYTFTNLTIENGATLKLVTNGNGDTSYTNDPGLQVNLTNLSIASGGRISADGTGYPGAHESGTGPGAGISAWNTGGGGGHGGVGQSASGSGGIIYDSLNHPTLPGSSGGAGQDIYHSTAPGGAGGGAIWLVVGDTANINGVISADGVVGAGNSGGGSGGSIIIEADTLLGTGSIHANGGPQNGGGNGAGGRVAIYATTSNHTILTTANGATGYEIPGKGTVYFDILGLANSTVEITPAQVIADGADQGTIIVTLKNVDGYPMPNKPVEIAVIQGPGVKINGQPVSPNQFVSIGTTDENGIISSTLSTGQAGIRVFQVRSNQETILNTASVEFTQPLNGPIVEEQSVVSSASAGDECADCIGCSVNNTQGSAGGPINTRTGGYDYTNTDISFVTSAGELSFVRTYSSLVLSQTTNLSLGWTHNHDMRLIFPSDPGGQEDVVLLKSRSANEYSFYENQNGTYEAAPGIRATLVRNSGSPVTFTVTDSNQNIYVFNVDGQLTTFENPQGNGWSYTYNANDDLDRVSGNDGISFLEFDYDTQERVTTITDHTGRIVAFAYDTYGDLISVTDILGQIWTYEYDEAHRITKASAPDLTIIERTEYDSQGRAVRQYDGENNLVVEMIYHADGTTTVKDGLGYEQTHTYDGRGTLVGETNGVGAETTTVYGDNFQPTSVSNAAGHTLEMTWSTDGVNLLNKTDPAGNTTSNTYDALNNLTSTTNPLGNTTSYTYAGKLLTSTTDSLGGVTSYTYTSAGYLSSVTDSQDRITTYTYTASGQRASMTDSSGNTWQYTYDALGRLTDTIDPRGRVSHTEYNPAGQIVRSVQNYSPTRPQNDQNLYNIVTDIHTIHVENRFQ
ncbi:DUF6531 domain-containing protein [Candidatus Villigracilis affinis]|uniref:DUF6531 domain-containing protein n=1 Tax=Candidatus Villigracilis affinis TaxID=3140682 RepID=UPI001D5F748F|nr:hypothetical protein [Anaerolineales bacterium]